MTPEELTHILRHTLLTAIELAAPFLLLALIVGLVVATVQSITQIHEMTLSFVPKMLIVALAVTLFFPWMLKIMTKFSHTLFVQQFEKVTHLVHYVLQ